MSSIGTATDGADRARFLPWTRVLFVLTVIGTLALGFLGIRQYVASSPEPDLNGGFWNVAYYDLQLFVLGSEPLQHPGPYPLWLNLARFAAPTASVYALFEAGRALFYRQYRQWRQRHQRGHIIVSGDSAVSRALVARLRGIGRTVTQVQVADRETLADGGIAGASVLYACADDATDGVASLATVMAAATARGGQPSARRRRRTAQLRVYAQVADAEVALALRARRLGLPVSNDLLLDFFNIDELAARHLLGPADVEVDPSMRPHIVVAGLGDFGRAVVVEYARYWRLHSPRRAERVAVTLVGPHARTVADDLAARWDVVAAICDLTPVESAIGDTADRGVVAPPHRVFICYEDEDLALRTALTTVELWRGGEDSIVVRLDRLDRHGEAFHTPAQHLLDNIGGRLRLVGVTKLATDQDFAHEDLVERLAEAIHEQYLLERLRDGMEIGQAAAMRPWSQLDAAFADANRTQAADIGRKLASVGCTVATKADWEAFAFADAEVDQLAKLEHDRWVRDRALQGWVFGEVRDDAEKRHPAMVDWAELAEGERKKDRDAVRSLPTVLASVGLRIVRLRPPAPAQPSAAPALSQPPTQSPLPQAGLAAAG